MLYQNVNIALYKHQEHTSNEIKLGESNLININKNINLSC